MLSAIMLSAIMLSAIMLSAIMLSAIMLSVIHAEGHLSCVFYALCHVFIWYAECHFPCCRYAECRDAIYIAMTKASYFVLDPKNLTQPKVWFEHSTQIYFEKSSLSLFYQELSLSVIWLFAAKLHFYFIFDKEIYVGLWAFNCKFHV